MKTFFQLAGAVTGCFALGAQLYLIMKNAGVRELSYFTELVRFFSYMTIWTNIIAALCFLCPLLFSRSRLNGFLQKPWVQAGVALYVLVVAVVYHFFLAQVWDPSGLQYVADILLHYIMPLLYLLYWGGFAPKGRLNFRDCVRWLAYPLLYVAYALARGALTGEYPYPFIDVTRLGYEKVLLNAFLLGLAYLAAGGLLVVAGRLFPGRPASIAGPPKAGPPEEPAL